MNKRAIIKKIIKRKNKHNHYYGVANIIFKENMSIPKVSEIIDVWVTYNFRTPKIWIVNMKQRHIKSDTKMLINNLIKSNLKFKIK